ncbi:MAG: DUF4838 domain-containing protein [Phaeodactylibacter sp.]|nr:DUF4838 domain-containing protein [Phaeodactylibacter sp.]MCB9287948.1 DUF4838 domain-containing protein [Lewinellaceae bacterium]
MALKILTGILRPNPAHLQAGRARIFFDPHHATEDAMAAETMETGAEGSFTARPGQLVAVRDFVIEDRDTFWGRSESDWFRIDIEEWTVDHLVVSWSCEPGAAIREISYMIVGEVAEVDPRELAAGEVLLASGGEAQVEIKVLDEETHQKAAEELRDYLNKIAGPETFSITTDDPTGPAIYLGDPSLVGITRSELGPDGFVVAAKPHASGANDLVIAGGSELAAYYGVTAVLESLGFRWYLPNEIEYDESSSTGPGLGEKWPEPSDPVVLRPPLPRSGLIHWPSFHIRGVRDQKSYNEDREIAIEEEKCWHKWGRRNFQNVQEKREKRRIPREFGINARSHTWMKLAKDYQDVVDIHPVTILEIDGREALHIRIDPWQMKDWAESGTTDGSWEIPEPMTTWWEGFGVELEEMDKVKLLKGWAFKTWNLCACSEVLIEALGEGIYVGLTEDPELNAILIMPEDNDLNCECELCRAAMEAEEHLPWEQRRSARVQHVANRTVDYLWDHYPEFMESHPGFLIISAAYNLYLAPPPDPTFALAHNLGMIFMRNREHNHALDHSSSDINREIYNYRYRQWLDKLGGRGDRMLLYEYYNNHHWLGLPWPVIHSLRRDIRRFYDDGLLGLWSQYQENMAPNGLVYYIAARLLWDVEADVEELKAQYCTGLFGPEAGSHMLAYYEELEDAAQASGLEFVGDKDSSPKWEIIRLFTPELFSRLNGHLNEAGDSEGLATEQQERIEGMKIGMQYARLMLCWIHGTWYHKKWVCGPFEADDEPSEEETTPETEELTEEEQWLAEDIIAFSEFIYEGDIPPEEEVEDDGGGKPKYRELKAEIESLLTAGYPWIQTQKYIGQILGEHGNPNMAAGHSDYWVTTKPEWRAESPAERPMQEIPEGSNLALWICGLDFDWEELEEIYDRGEHLLRIYNVAEDPDEAGWREILPRWAKPLRTEYSGKAGVIILDNISSDDIGCTGPWAVEIINQPNEVGLSEENVARAKKSSEILGIWLLPEESSYTMPSELEEADVAFKSNAVCAWNERVETSLDSIRQSAIAFVEFPYDGKICSDRDSTYGRQDVKVTISR